MTQRPEGNEQRLDLNRVDSAVAFHMGILADEVGDIIESAGLVTSIDREGRWTDLGPATKAHSAQELSLTVGLESRSVIVAAAFLLSSDRARDLQRSWDRFHDNLPFDAAELRWLNAADRFAAQDEPVAPDDDPDDPGRPLPDYVGRLHEIASRRGHITNRGHAVEVSGSELIDRWWDWRRCAGDYASRDAVGDAYEALRRVKDLAISIERGELGQRYLG